ncbi:hypothetical protein [Draconibacterium orientale]|uniref:hypothetical protein n=1 Tax=Draconibacterium orientale TaxID=1168034 RepID=UPI002A0A533A|nr:hypothetical protein [Draconibacterium orientale]
MKYNLHNTWKGNAPPGEEGNPFSTVISKEGRLRDLLQQSSTVTDSSPDESGFGMTRMIGGGLRNMRDGFTRHAQQDGFTRQAQRDGPRGRAPANSLTLANGLVTLNQKTSVSLCGCSVNSVVKKLKPQRKPGSHRERREITNKGIPPILHGLCSNAGGKANDGRVEYFNSRILECQAVILSVPEG